MSNPNASSQLILPAGTHIVSRNELYDGAGVLLCPRGAVGVIAEAPAEASTDAGQSYRIVFVNGVTATLARHEFSLRKQYHSPLSETHEERDLWRYIIYRCVTGSRAYGLETEASDTDRRGIYLPPASLHWSLRGVPEQLNDDAAQECFWELQKFLTLALKANPNILECLYSPLVEHATPLAEELLALRDSFLSQLVYQTYNGYVMSQFKKLEQDLRTTGKVKWKHAMHLIRLLMSGIAVLRDGFVTVHVGTQRESLLAIRRGEVPWDEVNALRLQLHKDFDGALTFTRLPERPDVARANAFLLKARRAMVDVGSR